MDTKPFISVVIPAYNEEKYLPECLDTLNNQLYPRDKFEVIVVDNNSKDNTAKIAREKGFKVHTETKQGYVHALNSGLKEAKGEIIAVTDADTEVAPDWLAEIAQGFADPRVVGATGSVRVKEKSRLESVLSSGCYNLFVRINFLIGKPHLTGFNLAVRAKALNEIGGLNVNFTMSPDVDMGLRIKKLGKVIFLKKMLTLTSMRRWDKGFFKALGEYTKAYFYAVWLRKSPGFKLPVIR